MSTTIDQRVVEMRFDNRHFENNVKTTMSTLEKLKKSLHLDGAAKGLDNVNAAAKKVDISPLGSAVDNVKMKFSALDVMAVTALANITNSAVNAGKRIVSALTIDPIKTGFQEYETQINSVQTILANTQSKGTTLNDVNKALDTLNTYADKTIYNFTEMTRNIGTFTAAGVDLQTSVDSIQGIANLAAISGSTSQQASTAMYQLSQALAAGRVSLMDWNSVVNAGMGGEVFQNALKRTATHLGKNVDAMIEKYGSFRESLTQGEWLTTEVLTETLSQLSGAYTEADLIAQGYTKSQAQEITQLAQTAVDAATKVKTFSQLWDTLKEAAQSGWTQTWELIIGDFEQSKEFFSGLSDTFGGIINSISEARNNFLGGALKSNWDQLIDKVNEAGISTEEFSEKLKATAKENGVAIDDLIEKHGSLAKAVMSGDISSNIIIETLKKFAGVGGDASESADGVKHSLEELGKVADRVLKGEFGNGEERVKKLTEAGYDYAEVQNVVNEKLGSSVRHLSTLTEEQKKNAGQLAELSDEQLKSKGYTEEQITAIKDLAEAADKAGTPINDLIENISRPSGRDLLIGSITNSLKAMIEVCKSVGAAWKGIFGEADSQVLYDILAAVNKFTASLIPTEANIDNLTRTFKGLFAAIDIVATIAAGPIKIAFEVLSGILGSFNLNILDFTAVIGDNIVKLRDWVDSHNIFVSIGEKVGPVLKEMIDGIKAWIDTLKESDNLAEDIANGLIQGFEWAKGKLSGVLDEIKSMVEDKLSNISIDGIKVMFDGFKSNFKSGSVMNSFLTELGNMFTGVSLPSTGFTNVGKTMFTSFKNGIKTQAKADTWAIIDVFADVGEKVLNTIQNIDTGALSASAMIASMLYVLKRGVDTIDTFAKPFGSLAGVFDNVKKSVEIFGAGVNKTFRSIQMEIKSEALKNMAVSILILAGAVYILAQLSVGELVKAGVAIAALVGVLWALSAIATKMNAIDLTISAAGIVALGAAIALIVVAVKKAGEMSMAEIGKGIVCLAGVAVLFSGVIFAAGVAGGISSGKGTASILAMGIAMALMITVVKKASEMTQGEIDTGIKCMEQVALLFAAVILAVGIASKIGSGKGAGMILGMTVAMAAMIGCVKLAGSIPADQVEQGISVVKTIGVLFTAFIAVSKLAKHGVQAGVLLAGMSAAMAIMVGVVAAAGQMDASTVAKGIVTVTLIGILFAAIIKVSQYAGKHSAQAGVMLLGMSVAIGIAVMAVRMAAGMSLGEIAKGAAAIAAIGVVFAAVVTLSKFAGKHAAQAGIMFLAMSGAILVLSAAMHMLSTLTEEEINNGLKVVTRIGLVFAALIAVSKLATPGVEKSLLALAGAIAILSVCVTALCFVAEDGPRLAKATAALITMMAGMALVMNYAKGLSGVKMGPLIVLSSVIVLLSGIVVALCLLVDDMNNALKASASIATLLLSLSISMKLLNGSMVTVKAVGTMAIMALIIAEIGAMLWVLQTLDVTPSLETCAGLSALILALSGACALLTIAGAAAPAALAGIGVLAALIAALTALAAGIGGLMSLLSEDQMTAIETGLDRFASLMNGIGEAFGSFVNGVLSGILGDGLLTQMATDLSNFAASIQPFIDGMRGIDEGAAAGAKNLALALLALSGADLLNTINIFSKDTSLADFGAQLAPFGKSMAEYAKEVAGVDGEAIKSSAEAARALVDVANTIGNQGGLLADIMGDNTLSQFGTTLVPFAKSLKLYSQEVTGLNVEPITASAPAAQALIDVANTIGNQGGILAAIVGDNTLSQFGTTLVPFGAAMKKYSEKVVGLDVIAIQSSATAAQSMVDMANTLGNSGGLVTLITGDNDLATFGTQMVSFGTALKKYSEKVAGIDPTAVAASAVAGRALVSLANSIPSDGGFWGFVTGEQSLGDFAEQMVDFAKGMKSYSEKVTGIDIASINGSISGGKQLISLSKSFTNMGEMPTDKISSFKTNMPGVGTAIKNYSTNVAGTNAAAITTSVSAIRQLVSALNYIASANTSGVAKFKQALNELATVSVSSIIASFSASAGQLKSAGAGIVNNITSGVQSRTPALTSALKTMTTTMRTNITSNMAQFQQLGTQLIEKFTSGIKSGMSKVQTPIKTGMQSAITTMKGYQSQFQTVGGYLMDGLKLGIKNKANTIAQEAAKVVRDAVNAAKAEAGVESPSKVFAEIGMYMDEGLAKGLNDYSHVARNASTNLGSAVIKAMKDRLKIKSPSVVFKEEVGRYIAEGIAEGITSSMAAEEAAAQKAQNIVSAFQAELDKIDLSQTTMDLENKLALAINPNMSAGEQNALNYSLQAKTYENLVKKAQLAEGEYLQSLDEFGAESNHTIEAYQKHLQAQINMYNAQTELSTLQSSQEESKRAAYLEMIDLVNQDGLMDKMKNLGYSEDDVWKWAADKSGYSYYENAKDTLEPVQTAFQSAANNTLGALTTSFSNFGTSYAEAVGTGVQNGTPGATVAVQTMGETCANAINNTQSDWHKVGSDMVDAVAQGIRDNQSAAIQAAVEMAKAALNAAREVLGVVSEEIINPVAGSSSGSSKSSSSIKNALAKTIEKVKDGLNGDLDTTLTITPVLDLTNVQRGVAGVAKLVASTSVALAGANAGYSKSDKLSEALSKMVKSNEASNNKVISTMNAAASTFESTAKSISGMSVTMDSGAVVGSIANKVDSSLGRIAAYKGRKN